MRSSVSIANDPERIRLAAEAFLDPLAIASVLTRTFEPPSMIPRLKV